MRSIGHCFSDLRFEAIELVGELNSNAAKAAADLMAASC